MAYRKMDVDVKPNDLSWVMDVLGLYRPRGPGHYTLVEWDRLASVIRNPLSDGDEDFALVCFTADVENLPHWCEQILRDDSGAADLYEFGDLSVLVKRHA